ncbi:extracellular solute-binding protein [Virgisporangium ochraceum]|jgi:multiple sugar transport system substrate-binding protein|uniref:ABC transporter substrate-binding protein n=1 Tax=Virgisporangium ochraceum TaxID=65505 RepID=A0A8J3ZXB4_9ACTN|nr:ABC transporter substrate-binding protein [Virgisporangium ochraceum]GIJ70642.1 ABC transporter substrate-binding protein [Virgisporangium ochraceum]
MTHSSSGRSPAPAQVGFPLFGAGRSSLSRRSIMRGAALGAGTLPLSAALAACGDDEDGGSDTGSKEVSFGSNYSDEVPKNAMASVLKGYEGKSGGTVKVNTVDHNTFQENINRYLQGTPDDVFTWFAGYRMQFFARQGLAQDISDVWSSVGGGFTDALKKASTGEDGKQYFVPFYYYPWAVFYRKSLFQQRGYTPPKTLDEFKALCEKMKADGIVPVAFADKDGWPAMGTFDYLNMRINGYDFHVRLMAGKESWTSSQVKQVFDTWRGLLPYHQPAANGRTWQEAAQSLVAKQSGMYVLGAFVGEQFSEADRADLDFFAFPEINPQHKQDAVEAPIDGFMVAKEAKNVAGAKNLMKYLATSEAELLFLKSSPNNVATHKDADTSGYSPLQKKCAELVSGAKQVSQFLDRDTRPDFASTVMIPSLQSFINNPNDVDGLLKSIENQKKSIFTD